MKTLCDAPSGVAERKGTVDSRSTIGTIASSFPAGSIR